MCLSLNVFLWQPVLRCLTFVLGQRFALLEEKVVLMNVIRHFRVRSAQAFDELHPCQELVLRPKDGIIVQLSPRV